MTKSKYPYITDKDNMANKITALIILILVSFMPIANAFEYEEQLKPESEKVAREIFDQLNCLQCEGSNIVSSDSKFAVSIRALVRTQIKEGKTRNEVMDNMVGIYGEEILLNSNSYFLYIIPFAFLILLGYSSFFRKSN